MKTCYTFSEEEIKKILFQEHRMSSYSYESDFPSEICRRNRNRNVDCILNPLTSTTLTTMVATEKST